MTRRYLILDICAPMTSEGIRLAHVEQGSCPFGGSSSLEGILAPSDQHAHTPAGEEALV